LLCRLGEASLARWATVAKVLSTPLISTLNYWDFCRLGEARRTTCCHLLAFNAVVCP
jgi:hypothetical protein